VTSGLLPPSVTRAIKLLLPPVMAMALSRWRQRYQAVEWTYGGRDWPAGLSLRGWDAETVAERARSEWAQLESVALTSGHVVASDVVAHNTMMSFAYAFGRAARGHAAVSFLDWGGGVGRYNRLARTLFPDVDIDYHCRDLPVISAVGRSLQPDVTFHDSDDDAFARRYDFVLASSSLHYSEDWKGGLQRLARVAGPYLMVTRQPFVERGLSYVVIQRPSVSGYYDTEYPGWVLNREEFLGLAVQHGLDLEQEFVTGESPFVHGAPEQPIYRGFLFRAAR